jgi:hypothetical protein
MFVCPHCEFKCAKRGDWKRHEQSGKHLARLTLEGEKKALEEENERLRALVLEQQAQFKKAPKMVKVKEDCAVDWSEFLETVAVEDTDAQDVTNALATTLSKALRDVGAEKSPLQCLDVKRKKWRVKIQGAWESEQTKTFDLLCASADHLRYKLMQKAKAWQAAHPFWFENEAETELFAQRMQTISAEIDYDRYVGLIASKSVKA